jgi:DNA invertase Pin-like site-specific DNA recombinase
MLGFISIPEASEAQADARAARERPLSRIRLPSSRSVAARLWEGEPAAVYCRISHIKDKDQTSVERQERICRDIVARLGLALGAGMVFIDPNRSAWKRNRSRPGWDALLDIARGRGIRHIVVYHPDRPMLQPWDLEELLKIADDHGIILHRKSANRDLSDPDDRHYLRGEVAHACRSSDDTSRRVKEAMIDRARDGKPHAGGRKYGYAANAIDIVEREAGIVRWVFESFLNGMTPYAIAEELNRRG